eukprot:TRINITY_DN16457_c0_g1_i1.p1 TRINITY_DN16457_c0_g1~~TRINITY_DN16457_c0_g1_i1.p1  ORF type:complete len:157 (+),score=42.84 TRINITY_DN16457_c0_g1_i1:687-1157(+)
MALRPHHKEVMKYLWGKVSPDIACFGCVLYEMISGKELHLGDLEKSISSISCSDHLKAVLNNIFYPTGGFVSVDSVLKMEPFASMEAPQMSPKKKISLEITERNILDMSNRLTTELILHDSYDDGEEEGTSSSKRKKQGDPESEAIQMKTPLTADQ